VVEDQIRQALQRYQEAQGALDLLISAVLMSNGGAILTGDRRDRIGEAFLAVDDARGGYYDALRTAGFTPPHRA
jgi:hypothetical protein